METNNTEAGSGSTKHRVAGETNGTPVNGVPTDGQVDPRMVRAAEIVDQLADRMASWTRILGRNLLWLGERLREEAEDIWTEAQSIRRGEKP